MITHYYTLTSPVFPQMIDKSRDTIVSKKSLLDRSPEKKETLAIPHTDVYIQEGYVYTTQQICLSKGFWLSHKTDVRPWISLLNLLALTSFICKASQLD